ncbi:MAG: PQQ-binding-like beta-propeller repeat protein [Macellibacteroides sp.]|uniref:outer membrane protein assembly factor BamB family protein n=1 Tax=Macellibacteroides sp. TaxID=2014584 RepID=UPI003E6F8E6E|nr:PQQ-binding-like beta-propeller repeat protein [Eubacteriales bacterium]
MKTSDQKKKFCYLGVALACLVTVEVTAQSPYSWRGPERNGNYYETGLLKTWPTEGPELIWETLDAGKGYSSPVVFGDRLYVTGMNEDETKEIFSAYTLTGKKIYEIVYGSPWDKTYPETRTTPTIEGNKAYVISGAGEIVCINIKDGAIVWKVDGANEFKRKTGIWGTSESPLVFDNKVIYTPGGDVTTMVALNAETGKVVWKSKPLSDNGSYVSPLLIMNNGKMKIIAVTGHNVVGVNPETGNIEWTFNDWGSKDAGRENIATNTPIYDNGYLFFSFGYDIGAFMLRLNVDATNASLVWRNNDLDTHHGGFVLHNGIVFGSNWINNNQGNWVAVDWKTGKTLYDNPWSGGKGKGSIVAADNMLYCYDERRGTVGLVKPSVEKFDVVSEFRVTKGEGPHWAHPVIQNGVLYIRHGNALMAYKIK